MTCKICGTDTDAHDELCPACKSTQPDDSKIPDATQLFEQIRTLRIIGQDDEALALCDQLTRSYPDNAGACVLMGDLLVERKHLDQAVMWYQRALKLLPDDPHIQPKLDHALNLAMGAGRRPDGSEQAPSGIAEAPRSSRSIASLLTVLVCLAIIASCTVYLVSTIRQSTTANQVRPAPAHTASSPAPVENPPAVAETTEAPPAQAAQPAAESPAPADALPDHATDTATSPAVPDTAVQPAALKQEDTIEALVPVAKVTGLSVAEARRKLRSSGLGVTIIPVDSNTVQPNRVIRSIPIAGAKVPSDTDVTLFVAQQPKLKDYHTWKATDAATDLKALGYRAVIMERETTRVAAGLILDTTPVAGAALKPGQVVNLYVARVPSRAGGWALPNLRDLEQEHAQALLTGKGYRVQIVLTDDDLIESGRVIGTSPIQGTPLQKGESVTIYVSR